MQTLKLIIQGEFYDSQIYSGYLYLWTVKGSIIIIQWEKLIDELDIPDELRFAAYCAFLKSENLYNQAFEHLFKDKEMVRLIRQRFDLLAANPLVFSLTDLEQRGLVIQERANPFYFPHADIAIFENNIYVADSSGIMKAGRSKTSPISPKVEKLLDLPALSIAAAFDTLAIASGDEGLFSFDLTQAQSKKEPLQLVNEDANQAHWMYGSIFSSSYFNQGFLADYWLENKKGVDRKEDERVRTLLNVSPAQQLLAHNNLNGKSGESSSFSWGVEDKICYVEGQTIKVVQYNPYEYPESGKRFKNLGEIKSQQLGNSIVRADSALFGYIVEGDDGLLVISSLLGENGLSEESQWLEGEPVNWRVFPNSKFYTNQLHIVYEDCLCIHSFNQDYFVDQAAKKAGISHLTRIPYYSKKAPIDGAFQLAFN